MGILEIIKVISITVLCYLIGAIPFCNIIAMTTGKKDLTKIGDKNPGGWNLIFNVSKVWGVVGIILDVSKGFFSYFIVYKITGNLPLALAAGCASVAGHNYSPYMRFSGGKGIAAVLGFLLAIHPLTIIAYAVGMLSGLFFIKNMLWGVFLGILTSGIFLWLFADNIIYLAVTALLLLIIIPKYVNRSINLGMNFKFRKEKTLKDLFTPKIR